MILILAIAFLSILILTVSISSFISKMVFNKKEEKEESKYDIESLEENASLSAEIKAANKEEKKAKEVPQSNNKFVVPENSMQPETIINNQTPQEPALAPAPAPAPTSLVEPTQVQQERAATTPTEAKQDAPIDPFNLNS